MTNPKISFKNPRTSKTTEKELSFEWCGGNSQEKVSELQQKFDKAEVFGDEELSKALELAAFYSWYKAHTNNKAGNQDAEWFYLAAATAIHEAALDIVKTKKDPEDEKESS